MSPGSRDERCTFTAPATCRFASSRYEVSRSAWEALRRWPVTKPSREEINTQDDRGPTTRPKRRLVFPGRPPPHQRLFVHLTSVGNTQYQNPPRHFVDAIQHAPVAHAVAKAAR